MTGCPVALAVVAMITVAACSDGRDASGSIGATTPSVPATVATSPVTDPQLTERPATSASTTTARPTPEPTVVAEDSVIAMFAGREWFLGTLPERAVAADPELAPIRLGMVNQEDTPLGSYDEVRVAATAAIDWVNAELGGVDGHRLELLTCVSPFDAERSRACARELIDAGVVAFVGGVDVLSDGSADEIERAGSVLVGGVPAGLAQQQSERHVYFSGGDAGALAAFASHAAGSGFRKIAIAYGQEVPSFDVAVREYGTVVAESLGLDVELIPFSIFAEDATPVVDAAVDADAQALVVLAAVDTCEGVIEAVSTSAPNLPLYLTGACSGQSGAGTAGRAVFNAEGPVDGDDVHGQLFQIVVDRYAAVVVGGIGTVGFRGAMNLYALLTELGPARSEPDRILALARTGIDRPSFWGHPYTCDGEQVPGLSALCAPQQILFRVGEDGVPMSVTGWIATDELFASALG